MLNPGLDDDLGPRYMLNEAFFRSCTTSCTDSFTRLETPVAPRAHICYLPLASSRRRQRARREKPHIRPGGGETFCCLVGSENASLLLPASVSPTPFACGAQCDTGSAHFLVPVVRRNAFLVFALSQKKGRSSRALCPSQVDVARSSVF